MSKVLMLVANNGFRDEEYFQPKEILQNNSIEVITTALAEGEATGVNGGLAAIDVMVDDLLEYNENIDKYDALAIIGGAGMDELIEEEKFHQLINNFKAKGKLLAAICVGPVVLAKAGALKDKRVTVFPQQSYIDEVVNSGAEYIDGDIAEDEKLITANGPKAAYKFGSALVKALSN